MDDGTPSPLIPARELNFMLRKYLSQAGCGETPGQCGQPRRGSPVLLQRGLLPQFGSDHGKDAQTRNKENLIPIKALPSQNRKTAQNNAVF
ncbi:hypothetical protein PQQ96_17715 [Paraburkholderia sediminicola]|uniref:hypothetical protein n=1 Tax=Paraburkholderia sediminicola TaxID=458836 RepID=UPI0038BCC3E6